MAYFVAFDMAHLGMSLHDSIIILPTQFFWTALAVVGIAVAHKSWTLLLLAGVAIAATAYHFRSRNSN
jgi:hypothetical protein